MRGASWIDGTVVGFDLETTGLDRERDEPVSYAFARFDGGTQTSLDEGWIQPERRISAGSARVHGLSRRRLRSLGARDRDVGATEICERLCALGAAGTPIVGVNLAYDLTIVDRTIGRVSLQRSLASLGWSGPVLDVLVLDRALDDRFDVRPVRTLQALCEHYGVAPPSHSAATDATSAVGVLLAQARQFPELCTHSLDELAAMQRRWHAEWCAAAARRRVAAGRRGLDAGESAWPYLERSTLW